ncbi:MAG: hypothetical protein ACXVPN_11460 [Bacteroidia bacterium]
MGTSRFIFTLVLSLTFFIANSQNKVRLDKNLSSDDSTALLTVASYPDSIRYRVMLACQKPEVLVKTEALQKSTSQSFRELVSNFSQSEQQEFWNLSRYPALVNEVVTGGKKSKEELESISAGYPSELKKTILDAGRKHYEVLTEINNLRINSQKEFEGILSAYPEQTQTAYRGLLDHPDVLNTLSTNMHLAVMLGDMYRSNPQQLTYLLDSVKTEHKKQSSKDLEEWKNGLENNPEAKKEMEQAAKEFTKEKGADDYYVDDVYNTGPAYDKPTAPVYTNPPDVNIVVQPYPYWFGYPWWFDYPYWYPYPYWYNCGFYWGPAGIVYLGFPSPYFMHWYFFHPYHHYYYSNFSDYCVGYHYQHYGPRYQRTGFNSEIQRWTRANEPNLPKGYFKPDGQRAGRIKELGRFEMDYHNSTKGVFGRNISRPEFLQNNSNYYPHLNQVISQPRFNKPITYPQQLNPLRFNMGLPGNSNPVKIRGGGFSPQIPQGGGVIKPRR